VSSQRFWSRTLRLLGDLQYALVQRVEHAENKRCVEMDCSFVAEVCVWASMASDGVASGVLSVPGREIGDTRGVDDWKEEAIQSQRLE
jgi:hypothetical protein